MRLQKLDKILIFINYNLKYIFIQPEGLRFIEHVGCVSWIILDIDYNKQQWYK